MEAIEDWLQQALLDFDLPHQPVVTLSYAQSLDGCLTVRAGQPTALSNEQTHRLTHALRAVHQAILVGIGTVLADDPRLTARLVGGRNPQPVVLDAHLRTPLDSALVRRTDLHPWIFASAEADAARRRALQDAGARVFTAPVDGRGRLDLAAVLAVLADESITSLMVEGGAQVLTDFLRRRLAQLAVVTVVPLWLGGLGAVQLPLAHPDGGASFPYVQEVRFRAMDDNLMVWGKLGEEVLA